MYDFLVGRFLSLSCGRPPTGQKERIVLDSIERLWCHLRRNEFMRFLYYYALSPVSDVIRI